MVRDVDLMCCFFLFLVKVEKEKREIILDEEFEVIHASYSIGEFNWTEK